MACTRPSRYGPMTACIWSARPLSLTPSKSKLQGIALVKWTMFNLNGEEVYTFTPIAIIPGRCKGRATFGVWPGSASSSPCGPQVEVASSRGGTLEADMRRLFFAALLSAGALGAAVSSAGPALAQQSYVGDSTIEKPRRTRIEMGVAAGKRQGRREPQLRHRDHLFRRRPS